MTREMLQQYGLLDRISSSMQPPPAKRQHIAAAAAAAAEEVSAAMQEDEHEFVYDMYVPVYEDEDMGAAAAAAGEDAAGVDSSAGQQQNMPVVQVGAEGKCYIFAAVLFCADGCFGRCLQDWVFS
jgi:hypothetical protein